MMGMPGAVRAGRPGRAFLCLGGDARKPLTPFEGIGASVKRKEDLRFLSGRGQYTDDINRPGQTYAYILRSPHAHAAIKGIDLSEAKAMPGVVAIFTGEDMQGIGGLPCGWQIHNKDG